MDTERTNPSEREFLNQIKLEDKPCPLGCQPDDEIVLKGKDRLHGLPGEFTVVRCRSCGLLRTNPRPTPETIGFYYPADYRPYLSTVVKKSDAKSVDAKIKRKGISDLLFRTYSTVTPKLKPGRLLEIGCASGAYMYRMAKAGWDAEGIELSASAGQAASDLGFYMHTGSLESAPDPKNRYDLIVGWMVLEHLHEPTSALKRLASWINPKGWLVISTPNAQTALLKSFGDANYDLHLPNHLYHYTPKTIELALSAGGWSLNRIFHQKTLNALLPTLGNLAENKFGSNRSLARWLKKYPARGQLWQLGTYPFALIAGLTKTSGRMTVWAQKSN